MKKKALALALPLLAGYYLLTDPAGAAAAVRTAGGGFADVAQALGDFLGALG